MLVPLRVAWLGPRRMGRRIPRLLDLITLGDPRDPNRLVQELFVRYRPDRVKVVAGDAALLTELRRKWIEARTGRPDDPHGFAEFVALQGTLALEVAEEKPEIRETLQSILRQAREAIVEGMRDALGVEVPDAEGVAQVILGSLDGISMGLQIDPEAISLDQSFLELRRITTFAVATRLNPDLRRWFDEPPGDYRLPDLDGGLQEA